MRSIEQIIAMGAPAPRTCQPIREAATQILASIREEAAQPRTQTRRMLSEWRKAVFEQYTGAKPLPQQRKAT